MNNNLYNNPNYIPNQSSSPPMMETFNNEIYAENLIKRNIGKYATVHMSYADSIEWRDRIYKGIIENVGRDYIVIHNNNDNKRYLLLTVYLDYISYDEKIT